MSDETVPAAVTTEALLHLVPDAPNRYVQPKMHFVRYDESGRITGGGYTAAGYIEDWFTAGERLALCATELGPEAIGAFYVAGMLVTPRPILAVPADPIRLTPNEERDVLTVGAAKVTVAGPVAESFEHDGGPITLGFALPGTYTVTVEAWPCRPADITVIVEAAS